MSGTLGKAGALHLRLFVENVEVPVIGAVISAVEGSPASAQIEVVPANTGLNLAARSKVLLFYLDTGDAGLGGLLADREEDASADDVRALTGVGYRLAFSGEVFSTAYSKVGYGARSLTLQCLDDSNNWDTAYLYMLRYSASAPESVVAGSKQTFMGLNSNANQLDDILSSPEEVIRQVVQRQRAIAKEVGGSKGLLGGLLGVLELLGGVQGRFIGITAWHTVQEARVRLMSQIAADSGETAANLFDIAAFTDWLTNRMGNAGTVVSFRELIDLICRYVFYTVAPNPVGVYRAGERKPPDWPPEEVAAANATVTALDPELQAFADQILDGLFIRGWNGSTPDKPAAVVTSTVRTRAEQIAVMAGTRREGQEPNSPHMYGYAVDFGIAGGSAFGFSYAASNVSANSSSLHKRLIYHSATTGSLEGTIAAVAATDPTGARLARTMVAFYRDLGAVVNAVGKGRLTWGGDWSRSDPFLAQAQIGCDPVHVELREWKTLPNYVNRTASLDALADYYSTLPERERLLTQYFRPDVWFVPPPACNVIFPEEVTSLSYSRDMMRETTRLHLDTYDQIVGEDAVLNQVYFAPVIEGTQNLTSGGLGSAAEAFIYPHEKFSGIIPKMERIADLAFYARLSPEQRVDEVVLAEATSEQEAALLGDVDGQVDLWAARTATFTYLSYRYSARSLSVSTTFLPRLVCGFPALVIDRTAPEGSTAEERKASPFSPNHFIGMVRSLTHSLTQQGGSTNVSLSHARTHKTDTDDLFAASVYDNKGLLSVQVTSAEATPFSVSVAEGSMSDADFRFCLAVERRLAEGMDPNSPSGLTGPTGRPLSGKLTVERSVDIGADNSTSTHLVAGSTATKASSLFSFTSVSGAERGAESYIPLEEAIRPPWVSDEYSNQNIGTLYQSFFGCGSIMDLYTDIEPGSVNGVQFSEPGIADAVEKIVDQYTALSGGGQLGSSFIREVTSRDYASLAQVVGTADAEGFFWQSCGDFDPLSGYMFSWMNGSGPSGMVPGTQLLPGEQNKVDPRIDPRRARWERAKAYQDELLRNRGLRG